MVMLPWSPTAVVAVWTMTLLVFRLAAIAASLAADGEQPLGAVGKLHEPVTLEFSYEARIRNMSPYGALIETELPLLVGSSSTVSIRSSDAAVSVTFSVVFSRELADASGNRTYQLGVEFTGVDHAQREALTKLIFGALA